MAKPGLIVLGLLILFSTFFITQFYITPQQKQQIKMADKICNFEYLSVPLGSIAQSLSPDVAEKCEQIKYAKMIIDYSPFMYILGFIFVIIGSLVGEKRIEKEKTIISKKVEKNEKITKRCEKCGAELDEDDKFCKNCGSKIVSDSKKSKNSESYCKNCGEKLMKGDKFCPNCGKKVKK